MDLMKDLKASLYDRMSTPLFGALLLSWCYWNIEILLIIFMGSDTIEARIKVIKGTLLIPNHLWQYPVYTAAASLFAYPLVSTLVFAWTRFIVVIKQFSRKIIEKIETRPVAEFIQLKADYEEKFLAQQQSATYWEKRHESMLGRYQVEKQELDDALREEKDKNIEYGNLMTASDNESAAMKVKLSDHQRQAATEKETAANTIAKHAVEVADLQRKASRFDKLEDSYVTLEKSLGLEKGVLDRRNDQVDNIITQLISIAGDSGLSHRQSKQFVKDIISEGGAGLEAGIKHWKVSYTKGGQSKRSGRQSGLLRPNNIGPESEA